MSQLKKAMLFVMIGLITLSLMNVASATGTDIDINPNDVNVNENNNNNQATAIAQIIQVTQNFGGSGGNGGSGGFTYKPTNFALVKTTLGEVQTGPCSNVKILGVANETDGNGSMIAITNYGTAPADISGWRVEDDSGLVIGDRAIRGKTLAEGDIYLFRHVAIPADGTVAHIMSAETINAQGEVDRKYVEQGMSEVYFLNTWNYMSNLSPILKRLQSTGIRNTKWYIDFSSYY